ncbi:MAG: TlpA disulfide reductase family protein [Bacteroidota bacterium]
MKRATVLIFLRLGSTSVVAAGFLLMLLSASLSGQSRSPQQTDVSHAGSAASVRTNSDSSPDASETTGYDRGITGEARQQITAFVFRSLDDSSRYISNATVAGNVYLVDFWATWCPPCVEALPDLEKIYDEYHSRGFEIISLSFDSSDERIRHFREKRFRMPWLHGRLESSFNDILAITFHVENIPHYILIGRDSNIIATGDDLHGEKLRGFLVEALGKEK